MPAQTTWTDERDATLGALWELGLSSAEIARRMDTTKNSIIGRAHRLGLEPRPSPIKQGTRWMPGRRAADRPRPPPTPKVTLPALACVAAVPRLVVSAPVAAPARPVPVPAPPRVVVMPPPPPIRPSRQCEWLDGSTPKSFVRCDEPSDGSWCPEHRKRVFVRVGSAA